MSDKNKIQKTDREKLIEQRIEQMKSISPTLVNSDGLLDVSVLKEWLGEESLVQNNQGYYLNFAGKSLSRLNADLPTDKELKVEKGQSKDFDTTQNLIIRGDNLDVLKILRPSYEGKVKIIYIDPPYNTNNANFVYDDSFRESEEGLIEKYDLPEDAINFFDNMFGTLNHSSWLFAMYPRLKLARELLSDDGVILVQIDHHEAHALKLMMDEIYGERNFKEEIVWEYRKGGMPSKNNCFGKKHDIIFVYSKKSDFYRFDNRYIKEKNYYEKQFFGCKTGENGEFYTDVNIRDVIGGDMAILEDGKEKLENLKPLINTSGERIDGFDSQKPPNLIKFLFKFYIKDSTDSIVMDFFAGSGTTAQAVLDFNNEYGSRHKFILVQRDEIITEDQRLYQLCGENRINNNIFDVCLWRVDRAGENVKQETETLGKDLDIGYKVFSLTEKPKRITDENRQLQIAGGRETTFDTLYNMMAASGHALLTDPIEKIEPDLLYKVYDAYYVLGEHKKDLKSTGMIFIDGYVEISLESWLNTIGIEKENTKTLY